MVQVQLEDKDFAERKPYFEEGDHEVYITEIKRGVVTGDQKPYLEVSVLGESDQTDNIRLYISEAAAPYTLAHLGRIAVHNETTEKGKEAAREKFKKITDTDELTDEFLKNFKDSQAWIRTEEDTNAPKPNGGFYLRSQLFSWKPQPKTTTIKQDIEGGKPVDLSEIPF